VLGLQLEQGAVVKRYRKGMTRVAPRRLLRSAYYIAKRANFVAMGELHL